MARIAVFLVFLLVVLTFNAYACVLPLQQSAAMDCTSGMEEPVRGTCDAFLEMGPQPQSSVHDAVNTTQLECAWPVRLIPDTFTPLVRVSEPPRSADTPIHLSIQTRVLRI